MANVTFQTTTLATAPDATIVETEDQGGGVNRQVVKVGNTVTVTGTMAATQSGTWTVGLSAGTQVIGHVITDSGSVVAATLSAETTKVIGTVNQGTSPWVTSGAITGTVAVTQSGTWNIATVTAVTAITNTVKTQPTACTTGAQTSVAGNASSVTVLAANAARLGGSVYNDSTAILYLLLVTGGTASTTAYSVQLAPNAYFEIPFGYTGALIGIWASATGNARVTEYTA